MRNYGKDYHIRLIGDFSPSSVAKKSFLKKVRKEKQDAMAEEDPIYRQAELPVDKKMEVDKEKNLQLYQ